MNKKVKYILPATEIDMDGIPVKQSIPTNKVPRLDPFLVVHHLQNETSKDWPARHQGIAPHPHRGFTSVTLVVNGDVQHRDSRGNDQIAEKGDVQWMHAGAGIIHSERPSQHCVENETFQELIQLWVNVPKASKMIQPYYFLLKKNEMKSFLSEDGNINTKIIAGSYGVDKADTKTESDLLMLWSEATKKGTAKFEIPEGFDSSIYIIKGNMRIHGFGLADPESLINFREEDTEIEITADAGSQFLILSGRPIAEEIQQWGPYVMNSQSEVMEAMRDFKIGKMGVLIEE